MEMISGECLIEFPLSRVRVRHHQFGLKYMNLSLPVPKVDLRGSI